MNEESKDFPKMTSVKFRAAEYFNVFPTRQFLDALASLDFTLVSESVGGS